jgi:hypothetical protein
MKNLFVFVCGLSLLISIAPVNAVMLPIQNSFDSLDSLAAGEGTSIEMDTSTFMEGAGAIKMSWDASVNERGYFDWILPEDPDARGWTVKFNVNPPSFITEISLELIDESGKVAEGWYWNVQPSWYGRFNTITVTQGNLSGATSRNEGPGDITKVTRIRFDERSGNGGWSYNYWDFTFVSPEPTTIIMLSLGGLLLRRRK